MNKVFDIATLIVLGTMLGTLVLNPEGTKGLIDGVSNIWGTSLRSIQGKG